ncbi:MAG TPA: hypothetical protein VN914_00385 [Polyangia bacterium]|nr:hypothetical protein [Polyangia bacterium]
MYHHRPCVPASLNQRSDAEIASDAQMLRTRSARFELALDSTETDRHLGRWTFGPVQQHGDDPWPQSNHRPGRARLPRAQARETHPEEIELNPLADF